MSQAVLTYPWTLSEVRGNSLRATRQTRADSSPGGPIDKHAGVVHSITVQVVCSTSCIGGRRSMGICHLTGWPRIFL